MAGNNSCGSRSLRYGNMVHNVAAIDAVLADGTAACCGAIAVDAQGGIADATGPARWQELVRGVHAIARREAGEIRARWPDLLRRVGGYNLDLFDPRDPRRYDLPPSTVNLAHLLVGSEGTLAYTRRLHLKLAPLPASRVLGVVNFPTFYAAMDSARHIVRLDPVAVELVDRTMIDLARANPAFRPVIERALKAVAGKEPEAILLVEFAGDDRADQLSRLKQLGELMGDLGAPGSVVEMTDAGQQRALWEVRKAGLNIMMSMKGDGKPVSFIEDCAVPLEHLAEYTRRLTEVFTRHGTRGTWYAHASVGTLHVRPILNMRDESGASTMHAIAEEAAALVREYKGAYSGEHGDGLVRSEWIAPFFGPRLTHAFEEIKALFDPQGLMNPGKIVHPSKQTDRSLYRYPPGYRVIPIEPALDWSAWNVHNDPATESLTAAGTGEDPAQGLGKAVEMCNNNGTCRKFDAGTMCPSYRVTRDEQHATRGRANTLRLALSGQLGPAALTSDAVREALSLCVSCKGCKRECPTGVDMARMKIEVENQHRLLRGVSRRDRLVASLPRTLHSGAARRVFGWLGRMRNASKVAAAMAERLTGMSARRAMPVPAKRAFLDTVAGAALGAAPAAPARGRVEASPERRVLLFADTFTNHFEPENAAAATRVLEAGGYTVLRATPVGERPLCCGRTFLAAGMVDEARQEAARTLGRLKPCIEHGIPIVGLEPSCLFTLRDEFLVQHLGDDAPKLAALALTFEEFLARELEAGRLRLPLRPLAAGKALLHGHCHQKAFDAVQPIQQVLKLIPDFAVELIETSCCGMAGAFGFEAEHYAVSMQMGELSLLPAVRDAAAGTLIIADGTSCRQQIHDGARREALHVARILDMALAGRG
jgi:Fe-S oxidoreductase/FAD/FMN-containing dehydrogenase